MLSLYIAEQSSIHKIPAGIKLCLIALLSVLVYPLDSLWLLVALFICSINCYFLLGKDAALQSLLTFKRIIPLFVAIFIIQLLTTDWIIASIIMLRMLSLILLANLISLTTKMDEMMQALNPFFYPLRLFGINTQQISFAVALVMRFIPLLTLLMEQLEQAWKARKGGKKRWLMIAPLMIQCIRISDNVASALEARGGIR